MTMVSPERFAPEGRDVLARLRHVFKVYRIGDTGVVALGGVDLDVPRGEFLAVVGPSGAGKSTILNLLGGLDRASAGVVDVDGQDLGLLSDDALTRIAPSAWGSCGRERPGTWSPTCPCARTCGCPACCTAGLASDRRRGADELLALVDLADRANHKVGQLSGGEQQRAAIAVALSNTPMLLLADEPTAELDSDVGRSRAGVVPRREPRVRRDDRDGDARPDGRPARGPAHPRARRPDPPRRAPVEPVGSDGRVQLPDEAVAALGDAELEAEVTPDEVRLRRRSETGHA